MHVLIFCESFLPETRSASNLFFELSESLVKRGHQVSVVTCFPRYNLAESTDLRNLPTRENMFGIDVRRLKTISVPRGVIFLRALEQFLFGFVFFKGGLQIKDFDVILVYSPPLSLPYAAYWLGRLRGKPLIVNIQDLIPKALIGLGLLKNPVMIGLMKYLESFVYKHADFITVHSEGNKEHVAQNGGKADLIAVAHNWVDTNLIRPGEKDNEFSRKHGLLDKYVISFAGTMGTSQGCEVIIDAANKLKDIPEMLFLLVGDGAAKGDLEAQVRRLGLTNVTFLGTRPLNVYPQILHASDVCLVTLDRRHPSPVVPGKLVSIMAAGKPVLASIPLTGDTPKMIAKFNCGMSVAAGEPAKLAAAVLEMYRNRKAGEEMGRNGRKAAEKYFSREACISQYEDILRMVTSKRES